jgi:deoxycytidine triphosphate deaminase
MPLVSRIERNSSKHPVQPSSLDLTIGNIYVPGTPRGELGGVHNPRAELSLGVGKTAVIETRQSCKLPRTHGAILFPPATVSARGLLMTNPGHVDPGYVGLLSFTVINMGRKEFPLSRNEPIVTALLFQAKDVKYDYADRNPGFHGQVTQDLLDRLSHDFLDIDERAKRAAATEELKTRRLGLWVPIVAALVALGGAYLQTTSANDDEIQQLKQDVKVLYTKLEAAK